MTALWYANACVFVKNSHKNVSLNFTCLSTHLSIRLAESVFMKFNIMLFGYSLSAHSKCG